MSQRRSTRAVSLTHAVLAALAAVGASACFDDPYGSTGGSISRPDGGLSADKRGAGAILIFDVKFFGHEELNSGPFTVFGPFMSKEEQDDQWSYEEAEGSPFACKIVERTRDEYFDRRANIGAVQINIDLGGPQMPPCRLVSPELGWACIGVEGTGGDIQVVDMINGVWSLTNPDTIFGSDEIGRLIRISGATNDVNNGDFAIVDAVGENTVHFKNPAAVEELTTPAAYSTFAGRGPTGAAPSVADLAEATMSLTPDADTDSRYEAFSNEKVQFGDSFTTDTASIPMFTNFPMDGSEVTVGCNGDGGVCGRASASAVDIETTDAPLVDSGINLGVDQGLPPPVNKSVQLLCIFLTGKVVIPAAASQFIADSGATRVRTIYLRAETNDVIQENQTLTLVAGHAVGGLTDVE